MKGLRVGGRGSGRGSDLVGLGRSAASIASRPLIRSTDFLTLDPRSSALSSLPSGSGILVAVSGGADSVALLLALRAVARKQRWTLSVAHLNHGIRGAAADADAAFVRGLARRLGLRCVVEQEQVPALAHRRGISLEMAAREARYAFFARTARRHKAIAVATAHTADDQAETVLLRLLRGAGPAGLAGIPVVSTHHGLRIVRPLLDVTRGEVEAYLRSRGQAWREDATNLDRSIPRNRVRHELLPWLEREFNPRVREALLRVSRLIGDDDAFLEQVAEGLRRAHGKGLAAYELEREPLQACVPALRRRLLRRWLRDAGVPEDGLDFESIERVSGFVAQGRAGRGVTLSGGWRVSRAGALLRVAQTALQPVPAVRVRLRVPGETVVPELGVRIVAAVAPGIVRDRNGRPGQWPARASLDLRAWRRRALYVRTPRPGDRIPPYGLRGTQKLQDILIDTKVPRDERARIPVIECGGAIVWLPGYRIARQSAVTDPAKPALQLTITSA